MIRKTDRTLAEQMQLTEREFNKRKRLLDFTSADADALRACHPRIAERADAIVEDFYEHQTKVSEINLVIGDSETLRRLKLAMRRYILELFEGYYDADYVNRRLRIGKVHERIGVSPTLYLSAVRLLQSALADALGEMLLPEHLSTTKAALHKIIVFDTQLVFDTYITSLMAEVEAAKAEAENYAQVLEETVAERTRQLEELSRRDGLTNLYNQRGFYDLLRRELAAAERRNEPLALVYFDLNGFKALNDRDGHRAGDRVLTKVGEVLNRCARKMDFACRYGGDEFCVVLSNTNLDSAAKVCRRIVKAFKAEDQTGISFSIGIAQNGPDQYHDMDSLVREADQHMYASKEYSREELGFYITSKNGTEKKI